MEGKKTIITCPHCGAELEITLQETTHVEPTPSDDGTKHMTFSEMLARFNDVLTQRGYRPVTTDTDVYSYLSWAFAFANNRYDEGDWMFAPDNYPLVYDSRGADTTDANVAYNAMQAWLMASILAELVPDSGATTNTQTELFKLAYETGGGRDYPLYNGKTFRADPYAMRDVASVIYAICRGDRHISEQISNYRAELGGKPIPADCWDALGYQNQMLTDAKGRRGYRMTYLGYAVNTSLFFTAAPGPRIDGTTVCELPWPWEQGQDKLLFNQSGGNYHMDEIINDAMVASWNMMSQTPLSEWDSYPREKQCRLVNVAAIPACTYQYLMGAPRRVQFDGIQERCYDGKTHAKYYCFSETTEDTGLTLDGPFSDLDGLYRYNIPSNQKSVREWCIEQVTGIADNMRFPTQDPNYGRCRPGCKPTREGGEANPLHGAKENEIFNVDLTVMVADDAISKARYAREDGFAQDSPRSFVSGHAAQAWALALLFTQIDNDNTSRPSQWVRRAYEYGVNRSVGRFHWMSDVIYGRLFGAITLPILNAMSGLQDGLKAVRDFVLNPVPQPTPTGDWRANLIIKNETGAPVQSTGEIRLYVENHIGVNTYLPDAGVGTVYTFNAGETNLAQYDVHCTMNGDTGMDDAYDGAKITEVRFYDERHWNNIDAGYAATLDTADQRCSPVLRKTGATYVICITKL